ncbi:hypothetical protein ACS0TY_033203 [Phlomoides rotata]
MYAKHRNGPGNGYRPNALAMGSVAAASRIPPEGSMRGNRIYNSEYRSFNRGGYGSGGHSKQFQPPLPPPPPPRESDVFIEAGRMAAEYLISKGVLLPNAISVKWQNDSLKNQMGDFQGFRTHEAENRQMSVDGQASVHSRVGNSALDVPGRRRYSDEFNSMGSRNSIRGRKRTGSFKISGPEMNRELGRSVSWAGKITASPALDTDNDTSAGYHNEQPAGKDASSGIQSSSPGEATQEVVSGTDTESGLEKCNVAEDTGVKDSLMSNEKCLPSDAGEPTKKSDDANKFNDEYKVVKEEIIDKDLQQKHDENKVITSSGMEDGLVSKDLVDLVKHCKFVNVPTKARSSLTTKGSKNDGVPMNEDEYISKSELLEDSGVHVIDFDVASHQSLELKSLQSDVPVLENEMEVTYSTRPEQCLSSGSIHREQQPKEELSGFGSLSSMLTQQGEKRAIDFNTDGREDFKKLRQWVPLADAQANSCPPIDSSMDPIMQEPGTSQSSHLTQSSDQNSLDISLFSKDHADSGEFMEEKQLFPGSFKTCDLNLVGACDVNENHDADPMLIFSSITRSAKVTTPIDVDLSMNNNGNMPNKNGKHSVSDKDIEVIDLEKDSALEDQTFRNPERRGDTVFTDLDGFSNNVHTGNGIPDVQDGYGLMISELLGNDSSNSLHSHIGLPSTEGILADDDSIYMSLGEIPISLLGSWEQQSQDYGKPF